MTEIERRLTDFVTYCQQLKGDEKGEAQIFLDRLFVALGYPDGVKGASGTTEKRIQMTLYDEKTTTRFADLVIPGRVLIEMKKRGENLTKHHQQMVSYWTYLTPHPRYTMLCNFDEFWIYDMERQVSDPIDRILLTDLPRQWGALAYLLPKPEKPIFNKDFDLVDLTEQAAFSLSYVYYLLTRTSDQRDTTPEQSQRFILQCMVALFAENIGLLPRYTFTRIIDECREGTALSYEVFSLLFLMMNIPGKKQGGRFYQVEYFNGGLFEEIYPFNLSKIELDYLREAAKHDWSKIRPSIFGRIFEGSMNKAERHQTGAHFTSERDILRIIEPVIIRPWLQRIEIAQNADELQKCHADLCTYTVLDPACGSGNFLYVAYREMKKLEQTLFDRLRQYDITPEQVLTRVSARQFYGFDINPFAVELAKATLMIAKKLAVDEIGTDENPLPFENLDANMRCEDALFADWGKPDAIIGNPPYLGSRKLKSELGVVYTNKLRAAFPEVPGNADYCVYWFRKAHDVLPENGRAGLVGTNTIRQNYSRIGGLDYIVRNNGVIFEAVSSMIWREGDPQLEHDADKAVVHVSIACWSKGTAPKPRRLWLENGDEHDSLHLHEIALISSSLSIKTDVSSAAVLTCNKTPKRVFQGQIPGHEAFLLEPDEARTLIKRDLFSREVIHPFLVGRDLTAQPNGQPSRYVIDLNAYDIAHARQFAEAYKRIEQQVLPEVKKKAKQEEKRNKEAVAADPEAAIDRDFQATLNQWWKHHRGREQMIQTLQKLSRYIVCSGVTKRPIFDFVSQVIHPDHALFAFAFNDDYTFGILQSNLHWLWLTEKGSTLKSDYRYTPQSVFDTFPFPQVPSPSIVKKVADAGRAVHEYRREQMAESAQLFHDGKITSVLTLRELYRLTEKPGKNRLKDLHAELDAAVMVAYELDATGDILAQLLELNQTVAARITEKLPVTVPGIPPDYPNPAELVSEGCIQPPELL